MSRWLSLLGSLYPLYKRALSTVIVVAVAWFVLRWALTEYYVTTHCTMVLGTRVCQ